MSNVLRRKEVWHKISIRKLNYIWVPFFLFFFLTLLILIYEFQNYMNSQEIDWNYFLQVKNYFYYCNHVRYLYSISLWICFFSHFIERLRMKEKGEVGYFCFFFEWLEFSCDYIFSSYFLSWKYRIGNFGRTCL